MPHATSILISALGGEGGGVLAAWLSNAAVEADLPVQRTSIPGVAQRTGATTYYLEIFPTPRRELGGREPVLGLHPPEGGVDIIVATELLEASRALHRGYASKDRTLLIASTHRVYTIGEKAAAVHGRFNERTAFEAIAAMTREAIEFDCQAAARAAGSQMNAVLLGAIAASGKLPIPVDAFRGAMRREGKAVEENLRGFEEGLRTSRGPRPATIRRIEPTHEGHRTEPPWVADARALFPRAAWPIIREGLLRLVDYQGPEYAQLYINRLRTVSETDAYPYRLLETTARHLALWMSYEDVIRVAQLKTRPARFARIREAQRAGRSQPLLLVDFLKPGPAEFCSLLPPRLGEALMRWIERRGLDKRLTFPMRVRTSSILGFARMRLFALLRPWRPRTYGFRQEQRAIEAWLHRVQTAAGRDRRFATEIASCAQLVRGYADTRQRGYARLNRLYEALLDQLLSGERADAAELVQRARTAALADETGTALEAQLRTIHLLLASPAEVPTDREVSVHVDGR